MKLFFLERNPPNRSNQPPFAFARPEDLDPGLVTRKVHKQARKALFNINEYPFDTLS